MYLQTCVTSKDSDQPANLHWEHFGQKRMQSKVRELSRNSVTCQGKMKFCKKKKKMSGNCQRILHFSLKLGCLSRCICFAKFINCQGNFNLLQGNVREFWSILNVRTLVGEQTGLNLLDTSVRSYIFSCCGSFELD